MKKKKKSLNELSLNKNVITNLNAQKINGGRADLALSGLPATCISCWLTRFTKGNCIETIGDPGCTIETISWPG